MFENINSTSPRIKPYINYNLMSMTMMNVLCVFMCVYVSDYIPHEYEYDYALQLRQNTYL